MNEYGKLNGVPIELGDGWELVPIDGVIGKQNEMLLRIGWVPCVWAGYKVSEVIQGYGETVAFRRPITKPSQTIPPPMCLHPEVRYDAEKDNYYCQSCHGGMGLAYHKVARERDALKARWDHPGTEQIGDEFKIEWRESDMRHYVYSKDGAFIFSGEPRFTVWQVARLIQERSALKGQVERLMIAAHSLVRECQNPTDDGGNYDDALAETKQALAQLSPK